MFQLALIGLLAVPPLADLYVDGSAANCATATGSPQAPFCTISEALVASSDGDTIWIAPGTYFERLDVQTGITLIGTEGAGLTTIDAAGLGTAIRTGPSRNFVIDGITVTGGVGGRAGGIAARGTTTLLNSTISGNVATGSYAGGGWNTYSYAGTAIGCTFENNRATTLFYPAASAVVSWSATSSPLTIVDSTISGNIASGFRTSTIIAWDTDLIVRNTTISGNSAVGIDFYGYSGGGIFTATITDSTITFNADTYRSGGIWMSYTSPVNLRNTIVAGNTTGGMSSDVSGDFNSLGYNLIGNSAGSVGFSNGTNGDQVGSAAAPIDPMLLPLLDNGGMTRTHAPMVGSPVVDMGHPTLSDPFDQRGVPRPPSLADIGAHEKRVGTPNVGCTPNPNSTGRVARTITSGSVLPADNEVWVTMLSLPRNSFGYFITSQTAGVVSNPGGSQGVLCLGGAIGRFVGPGQVMSSGIEGRIVLPLDLTMQPTPTGPVAVQPGETWFLQGWYRDATGGVATSNFSQGVGVTFL